MSFVTHDNLCKVLDKIAGGSALGPAMRSIGATSKLIFVWKKRSGEGDPKFLVSWPDEDTPIQFAEAINFAIRMQDVRYIHKLKSEAANGYFEDVIIDGKIMYEENPEYIGWTDQELRDLLGLSHRFVIDPETGLPKRLQKWVHATAHVQLKTAEAVAPQQWGKRIEIDQRISGGVQVMRVPTLDDFKVKDLEAKLAAVLAENAALRGETPALTAPENLPPEIQRELAQYEPKGDAWDEVRAMARHKTLERVAGKTLDLPPRASLTGHVPEDDEPEHIGRDPNGPLADTGERSQGIPYNGPRRAGGPGSEFLGAPVTSRNGERAIRTVGDPTPPFGIGRNRVGGV